MGRVDRRRDRSDTLSDEKRVILAVEPLSRPEVPDGRESGSSGVLDEVVIGEDYSGGEQSGSEGGDLLDGDFVGQVDPSFVNGLLDRLEKCGRILVTRDVVELGDGSCGTEKKKKISLRDFSFVIRGWF